jgi:DNA excision repair protein ERCC-2
MAVELMEASPDRIPARPEMAVAVRALAEQVLQSGDLSFHFLGAVRAQEGIAGHRRVQSSRPGGYEPEVPVSGRVDTADLVLRVGGRIDGVFDRDGIVVVEEIKTTLQPPQEAAAAENPVHWGQARLYAHLLAQERGLAQVGVQVTYYQIETGRLQEVRRIESRASLAAFFQAVVDRYLAWARRLMALRARRDAAIGPLAFPFGRFRPGQREMAVAVFRAARHGRPLMVQAPTGIGKTMGAWFPAVKAVGQGLVERVFFLTARTTGRLAAEEALARLRSAGLFFRVLSLTAKERICFAPQAVCGPEQCPFARGHFDRLGRALDAALGEEALTRERVEALARGHEICPFAFSLSLAGQVDGIIGDYNYVFDPRVRLGALFEADAGARTLLLVDEAHNLVDRGREMYSAAMGREAVSAVRREVKTAAATLYRSLGRVGRAITAALEADEAIVSQAAPEALLAELRGALRLGEAALIRHGDAPWRASLMDLYFQMLAFARVGDGFDRRYVTLATREAGDVQVRLFCLDPSPGLAATLAGCPAAVLFSATLAPMAYFTALFGLPPQTAHCRLPSPFPREHFGLFVLSSVSTCYRDRPHTAETVVEATGAVVQARTGNYLVFFPSYAYLEQIHAVFARRWPGVAVRCQTPGMADADREAFLDWFPETPRETRVGFAVMGGVFGEGIDLRGERLTGAVVVGVGLPAICPEREEIRRFFDGEGGAGFDFAYRFPGFNRVLQAAGRVIRSASDRGVVVLIDARYGRGAYRRLLPPHWQPRIVSRIHGLAEALAEFWRASGAP